MILDPTLRPILNKDEVASLFSHPLAAFLSTDPPPSSTLLFLDGHEDEVEGPQVELEELGVSYYSWQDVPYSGPGISSISNAPSKSKRKPRSQSKHRSGISRDLDVLSSDLHDDGKRYVRLHRFLTGREAGGIKPVFGLTAAILIQAALIAHTGSPIPVPPRRDKPAVPQFVLQPPNAPSLEERIAWAMYSQPEFREACDIENLIIDWELVGMIAGVVRTVSKKDVEKKQTIENLRGRGRNAKESEEKRRRQELWVRRGLVPVISKL